MAAWIGRDATRTSVYLLNGLNRYHSNDVDTQRVSMKVLFVCVGNSCRSQMAEGFARKYGHETASAGTMPANRVAEKAVEVMAELDGVVCVDSAVAHLAGALGVRSWVLLSFAPDWRWGREGNSSPWYPSLTLVRQQYGENWATVSKRLATVFH